jgi:hypothetical protein
LSLKRSAYSSPLNGATLLSGYDTLAASQRSIGKEIVVRDEWREIRARLEMQQYAPCLTFYDRLVKERLKIGLRTDGSPSLSPEGREISV